MTTIQKGIEYWCETTSETVEAIAPDGDDYWLVYNGRKSYVVHASTLTLPDWDAPTILEREA